MLIIKAYLSLAHKQYKNQFQKLILKWTKILDMY